MSGRETSCWCSTSPPGPGDAGRQRVDAGDRPAGAACWRADRVSVIASAAHTSLSTLALGLLVLVEARAYVNALNDVPADVRDGACMCRNGLLASSLVAWIPPPPRGAGRSPRAHRWSAGWGRTASPIVWRRLPRSRYRRGRLPLESHVQVCGFQRVHASGKAFGFRRWRASGLLGSNCLLPSAACPFAAVRGAVFPHLPDR